MKHLKSDFKDILLIKRKRVKMYSIFKEETVEYAKEIYSKHVNFERANINISELTLHQVDNFKTILRYVKNN
jgi:hypothetical protein